MRILGQEQNGRSGSDRVGGADTRFHRRPAATLEGGQHDRGDQGENERADDGEDVLAHLELFVRSDQQLVGEKGERNPRRRHLWQGDAEEDHAPQDEIDADQRAGESDQNAGDERVAQQKGRAQDLEQRIHAVPVRGTPRAIVPFTVGIASIACLTARPSSTHTAERSAERMRAR